MSGAFGMKILAFELSSTVRSVAVLDPATGRSGEATESHRGHTQLFALTEQALAGAGCCAADIDCLAIGLGPGSYTGIRMAIAAAQGWHLARGTPLLGISSVESLAVSARAGGHFGAVNFILDAQRGEFYLAEYRIDENEFRETNPLRLAQRAAVTECLAAGKTVMGPGAAQTFAGAMDLCPSARTLAWLAVGRTDFVAPESLEPIYLREISFVKAPPPRVIEDMGS